LLVQANYVGGYVMIEVAGILQANPDRQVETPAQAWTNPLIGVILNRAV
jgi:hypothetical protein